MNERSAEQGNECPVLISPTLSCLFFPFQHLCRAAALGELLNHCVRELVGHFRMSFIAPFSVVIDRKYAATNSHINEINVSGIAILNHFSTEDGLRGHITTQSQPMVASLNCSFMCSPQMQQ